MSSVQPGALDVPAAWRKSLGEGSDLFSELIRDHENPEKQQRARVEPDSAEGEEQEDAVRYHDL